MQSGKRWAVQCVALYALMGCTDSESEPAEDSGIPSEEAPKTDAAVDAAAASDEAQTSDEGKGETKENASEAEKSDDKSQDPGGDQAEEEDSYQDYPDPRGKCDLKTQFASDEACILPPDPKEGFQIHIGPSNYDDAEEVAKYIMKPGEESSECWTFHTPNTEEVFYQTAVISGRAGTHHIINTMLAEELEDGGFARCADGGSGMNSTVLGQLPGASKPYMARGHVAPENKHIGRKIPARVTAQADMHYYNFTDKDIIREMWLNIYTVDKSSITETSALVRGMGGFSWSQEPIAPGTDKVYGYECPIVGNGRILTLLGHYHAHGVRFSASLKRGDADPMKVFEMYDYRDPATFEYDSRTKNPAFSSMAAGAHTGILEVSDGDVLSWECHIINDSDVGLRYVNEVNTGEMCNLWGSTIGIEQFNCLKP
jgi:hypothetical protein